MSNPYSLACRSPCGSRKWHNFTAAETRPLRHTARTRFARTAHHSRHVLGLASCASNSGSRANQWSEGNRRIDGASCLSRLEPCGRSVFAPLAVAAGFRPRVRPSAYASRMGTYTLKTNEFDTSRLAFVGVFFASVSFSPLEKEMKSRPGQGPTAVERNSKNKKLNDLDPAAQTLDACITPPPAPQKTQPQAKPQVRTKNHPRPVLPNPPAPRSLTANPSTILNSACTTGTITICANRSSGFKTNAIAPRFHVDIINCP